MFNVPKITNLEAFYNNNCIYCPHSDKDNIYENCWALRDDVKP